MKIFMRSRTRTKLQFVAALLVVMSCDHSAFACERNNVEDPNYAQENVLCDDDISRLKIPDIADYKVAAKLGRLHSIDFSSSPDLRNWKTVLSKGYAQGVNFAGRYVIVTWGCGSECTQNAIIDAETGKVFWPAEIALLLSTETRFSPQGLAKLRVSDDASLHFNKDSSLLIVIGKLGEDAEKAGIYFFRWDGKRLHLISKAERKS
jgi:hypothetical protein